MTETLEVNKRDEIGKRRNRRLRDAGRLPAVLYGHGRTPANLSLCKEQFERILRRGTKVVDLLGAETGQALLHDVQWDTFQNEVLHVDLLRLEQGERVTVEIPLAVRGEAPGQRNGGLVELLIREVEIEVSPASIPDVLHLNVNHLELGQALPLSAIEDLPAGAVLKGDGARPAVHCVLPTARDEQDLVAGGPAEPELIGRRAAEEESSED